MRILVNFIQQISRLYNIVLIKEEKINKMYDRISTYPGRYQITPVEGQENTFDIVRADGEISAGTPLNKSTLLTDATAALLNLGEDATPDDVLAILANAINKLNPASSKAAADIEALQSKTNNMSTTLSTVQSTLSAVQEKANGLITYGTSSLTSGTSNLATGNIYVKYE